MSLPLGLISVYDLFGAQFVTDEVRQTLPTFLQVLESTPWWLWVISALIIVVVVVLAQSSKEIQNTNKQLVSIRNSSPNILIHSTPGSRKWYDDVTHQSNDPPDYYEVQAWFLNHPVVNVESGIGRDVTAIIEAEGIQPQYGNWNRVSVKVLRWTIRQVLTMRIAQWAFGARDGWQRVAGDLGPGYWPWEFVGSE